jgi:hypothetical protein
MKTLFDVPPRMKAEGIGFGVLGAVSPSIVPEGVERSLELVWLLILAW